MRKLFGWGAAGLLACTGAAYVAADFLAGKQASSVPAQAAEGPRCVLVALNHCGRGAMQSVAPGCDVTTRLTAQAMAEDCPELPACPAAPEASEPILVSMPDMAEALRELRHADPSQGSPGGRADCKALAGSLGFGLATVTDCKDVFSAWEAAGRGAMRFCMEICAASVGVSTMETSAFYGTIEECEPESEYIPPTDVSAPKDAEFMPPVAEGTPPVEAGKIPYVGDGGEFTDGTSFLSIWLYWLKNETAQSNQTTQNAGQEQSELLPIDPAAIPPAPAGIPPGHDPSNCQEDPNIDHQYPGCPYMGGCPRGPGSSTVPAPKKEKLNKQTRVSQKQLWKVLKMDATPEDKGLSHRGLDTMECRPSDMRGMNVDANAPF